MWITTNLDLCFRIREVFKNNSFLRKEPILNIMVKRILALFGILFILIKKLLKQLIKLPRIIMSVEKDLLKIIQRLHRFTKDSQAKIINYR